MKLYFLITILLGLMIVGCGSLEEHAAARTEGLRKIYPPGTPKEQVQAKWGRIKPDFSAARPAGGWQVYQNTFIAKNASDVEVKAGKKVESVDRYWGPDGSMSLCYCWYFYDSAEKIVDVEWQYKSD